jgi:rod shape-determining protein MreC
VIVSVISLVLMVVDHRQHHLESIRSALSVLIYPLEYVVNLPVAASHWAEESLSTREQLLEENSKLRMQQTLMLARLQKLSALKVENIRLRELLQSSKQINETVLIGELLAVDLEPFTRQIVINKGTRNKVYLGQPLLDAGGIMGQIIHVNAFSSTAMLITDPNHAIPVQVNRNGLRAIAIGTGAPDHLEIPYLPNSADIKEGDLLTSSGLGGRFPPDYPVAKVNYVYKDPSKPYAVVTATPTANLERSREVLLVWTEQHMEDFQTASEQGIAPPDAADSNEQKKTPAPPAAAAAVDRPAETAPPQ